MFKRMKKIKLNLNSMSLSRKTTLYLTVIALLTLIVCGFVAIFTGDFLNEKVDINKYLNYELRNISSNMEDEISDYEGYALSLSRQLSRILDNELYNGTISISSLNDNPELLTEIQKKMYFELNTTLQMSGSSGAFVVLDATTNSKVDNSDSSRSGLYIKRKNVGNDVAFKQEYSFYRGIPDIAREHNIQFHIQWNLEFDVSKLDCYKDLCHTNSSDGLYYWTERLESENSGEDAVLLCFPIHSSQNDVYGICGIELSSMYFQHKYPAVENKYGHLVTIVAPMNSENIFVDKGMHGNTEGTWFDEDNEIQIKKDKHFNEYKDGKNIYYGLHRTVNMNGYGEDSWGVAVLIPKNGCDEIIDQTRMKFMIILVVLFVLVIAVSVVLSKNFVKPILRGFEDIQSEDGKLKPGSYGIKEFDALVEFLNQRAEDTPVGQETLPAGVEELFSRFISGVDKLTKAEYRIFKYYMDGYQVAQIPDVAFISMSTVKKHNRNIYEKLEVTSYDELMLYLDMLERCGKYDELVREENEEEV